MIHPLWLFHYQARIEAADVSHNEIAVQAQAVEGPLFPGLAGRAPRIRFWEEQMVLVSTTNDAQVKWFSFHLGDVVSRAARPGDDIEAYRDANGALALVLRRAGRLHVAVGALDSVRLGDDIAVTCGPRDMRVTVGDTHVSLHERESKLTGPYDVYAERVTVPGLDGPSPCASMALASDPVIVNAARRSAVLLARQGVDPLRAELLNGSYVKD